MLRTHALVALTLLGCSSAGPTPESPPRGESPIVAKGPLAEAVRVRATLPSLTAADARALFAAARADGALGPEDKDLFERLALGRPVAVLVETQPLTLPAADPPARAIAAMMASPPNLNTLWGDDPAKMADLVEISRWDEAARQRIVVFIANQLGPPLAASNVLNSFSPFAGYLGQAWNVMAGMGDATTREDGRRLLLDGSYNAVDAAAKKEGVPTEQRYFLFIWLDQDTTKETARKGKPYVPPAAAP